MIFDALDVFGDIALLQFNKIILALVSIRGHRNLSLRKLSIDEKSSQFLVYRNYRYKFIRVKNG